MSRARINKQRTNQPDVATGQPLPADPVDLRDARRVLEAAGAPPEVLELLDEYDNTDAALDALHTLGALPSADETFAELLSSWQPLVKEGLNPIEAELAGYEFYGMFQRLSPDADDVPEMIETLIEHGEADGSRVALAMLRSLAVTGPLSVRAHAAAAADRLVTSGVPDPEWVAGLGAPKPGRCFGYRDMFGTQESFGATFSYGRKRHAIAVLIDYNLGGGVKDCWVSGQPTALRKKMAWAAGLHDLELIEYGRDEAADILNRALSNEPCPEQLDQVEDVGSFLDLVRQRAVLLTRGGSAGGSTQRSGRARQSGGADQSDSVHLSSGAPTVHRMKITLRGSKPPIWRRLEVPSAATLTELYEAISSSFGWHGGHLWVFETKYGEYGSLDPELGHRDASSKRLHDVAPSTGNKLRYTYDFGDDWRHDIVVEEVAAAEPGVAYPRCLTGRRACPPEDCGGLWGYDDLLEILGDPSHAEHQNMLDWLVLDTPDQFDPAAFNLDVVNHALTSRSRSRVLVA